VGGSMSRRSGVVAVACAFLALPAAAAANTKTVFASPPPKALKQLNKLYDADANNFFIHKVTINQGDSVKFVNVGFHNVDFPAKHGKPLPLLVTGTIATGINDAAGNPFWFNGHVPNLNLNTVLLRPTNTATYDGTQRVVSGLPPVQPKPLKVTFTKVGKYTYFCDIHPGMTGQVVVLPKKSKAPTAKQDAKALAKQVADALATAKRLSKIKPPKNNVSLGSAGPNGVEDFAMFPKKLTVKSGTVVKFSMTKQSLEVHSATFADSASFLTNLAKGFETPAFPAEGVYPSDPVQPIALDTTSHSNGFGNTGLLDAVKATPLPTSGQVKFTAPGTYNFICLIHPFMQGQVVVKP
jgi:plastocyanin